MRWVRARWARSRWARRPEPSVLENALVAVLLAVVVVICAGVFIAPSTFPVTALNLPLVVGAATLGPRRLVWFGAATLVAVLLAASAQEAATARTYGALGITAVMCLLVLTIGITRSPIGAGNRRRTSMLVDLRDRVLAQGEIPTLPEGWLVESAMASAGGASFAGDFVVTTLRDEGRRLELVVVDVSGKGEAAGTRALQLSGAMGGLVTALCPDRFLPAVNGYLLQRAWDEGFATAIHLSLDLHTAEYEVRTAGHPPAVHRHAGSGRWEVLDSEGPVLGVVQDLPLAPARGRLAPGDSLLLYTDGMVEEPGRDIDLGVAHMMGEAESLLRRSWTGLAGRLVAAVGSPDDDRALLVVHRRD
ncbi:serine/threonine-protein phosphatase [Nocardioides sp. zg-536]|uniref:Serine/threonine-protein phosphatase n=1 Tax=Nocardioides faecalis TaxID=2803858 RepID=A0A938Y541_9ACTN|nr:PP2C family protein-serine/threonine phosphatase [Nocardioides faecalis]MBM9459382.1 serine/threonine-protein phosphatase [Nocardioides faecalis]QVI59509.1 serine/threonine-protein phosphatase [Nocardioides faecalis]